MAKTILKAAKPKTYTLTKEQFESLQSISSKLFGIRHTLDNLGENQDMTIGHILFNVGKAFNDTDWCEDELNNVIDSFEKEEDDINW